LPYHLQFGLAAHSCGTMWRYSKPTESHIFVTYRTYCILSGLMPKQSDRSKEAFSGQDCAV
jgi:hypothetical protein